MLDRTCLVGRGWWTDAWWPDAEREGLIAIESHSWDHNHATLPETAQRDRPRGHVPQHRYARRSPTPRSGRRMTGSMRTARAARGPVRVSVRRDERVSVARLPAESRRPSIGCAPHSAPMRDRSERDSDRWNLPRYVCGHHWRSSGRALLVARLHANARDVSRYCVRCDARLQHDEIDVVLDAFEIETPVHARRRDRNRRIRKSSSRRRRTASAPARAIGRRPLRPSAASRPETGSSARQRPRLAHRTRRECGDATSGARSGMNLVALETRRPSAGRGRDRRRRARRSPCRRRRDPAQCPRPSPRAQRARRRARPVLRGRRSAAPATGRTRAERGVASDCSTTHASRACSTAGSHNEGASRSRRRTGKYGTGVSAKRSLALDRRCRTDSAPSRVRACCARRAETSRMARATSATQTTNATHAMPRSAARSLVNPPYQPIAEQQRERRQQRRQHPHRRDRPQQREKRRLHDERSARCDGGDAQRRRARAAAAASPRPRRAGTRSTTSHATRAVAALQRVISRNPFHAPPTTALASNAGMRRHASTAMSLPTYAAIERAAIVRRVIEPGRRHHQHDDGRREREPRRRSSTTVRARAARRRPRRHTPTVVGCAVRHAPAASPNSSALPIEKCRQQRHVAIGEQQQASSRRRPCARETISGIVDQPAIASAPANASPNRASTRRVPSRHARRYFAPARNCTNTAAAVARAEERDRQREQIKPPRPELDEPVDRRPGQRKCLAVRDLRRPVDVAPEIGNARGVQARRRVHDEHQQREREPRRVPAGSVGGRTATHAASKRAAESSRMRGGHPSAKGRVG